jgi:aspartate carbamoyltransferase catalytic subunit
VEFGRKHILGLEEMTAEEIGVILDQAEEFRPILFRPIKKVPALRGRWVALLFYEASTRTRVSFEMAAKNLSADATNVSASGSSVTKGESLRDTILTLKAMGTDLIVMRHPMSGAPHYAAQVTDVPVINAGDGTHEHPTQGLLDLLTLREKKGRIAGLNVTIVGDVLHSRVARSNLWGLTKMGAKVRLAGPSTLLPPEFRDVEAEYHTRLEPALEGADVVMVLRIQKERQDAGLLPSFREYSRTFGINAARLKLCAPDVTVMHPGPMNRGLEISAEVADAGYSVITDQVTNGVALRMALTYLLLGGSSPAPKEGGDPQALQSAARG